jgi:hypothetical protein
MKTNTITPTTNRAAHFRTVRSIAQPYRVTCSANVQRHWLSRWGSTARFQLALTLVVLTSLALAPAVSAGQVINGRTGASYPTLQAAISGALAGDTLVVTDTCLGASTIDRNLHLQGTGKAVLDGNQAGVVITVSQGVTVVINNLTIIHGNSDIDIGGIFNNGTIAINDSTISDNVGTGIVNKGTMTINNSTISDSHAVSAGGGIVNTSAMAINDSTISGNTAAASGGGLLNAAGATLELNNSKVESNEAGKNGGGIFNGVSATLILNNSKVESNEAGINGRGIFNNKGLGMVTLNNSTVRGNSPNDIAP